MKLIKVSVGLTSINSNPNQLHNTIHLTLQHINDGHPFTINLASCSHLDLDIETTTLFQVLHRHYYCTAI